ncbi:MAG: ATP-binding protein, partial [Nitrososphaeraceae archaeon]
MKQNNYTADDIKVLSDNQHVRLRTPVYFGSLHPTTFNIPLLSSEKLNIESITLVPAVYKAVGEIIDNSLDEFSQINIPIKLLTIIAQPELGKYTIRDNGRGVPIDKHSTGKYTPEVVFGSLRSGRNFTDDKEIGVLGMNGVGSSCTNFCSTKFSVSITRDSNKYVQHFTDGATKIQKPKIAPSSTKTTGTEVSFELDPAVFKDVSLPDSLIRNRAIEIALTNPDITVEYNNEKFRFKKGFQEYINNIASDKINYKFNINEENIQGEIYVVCDGHSGTDELMYTWMNSSLLFDGGKCNTQFFNVLFDTISASLEKKAKKLKTEVTRNDIRSGLLVFANLKIRNPEYDSQSKTRQVGPDLRKEFISIINSN